MLSNSSGLPSAFLESLHGHLSLLHLHSGRRTGGSASLLALRLASFPPRAEDLEAPLLAVPNSSRWHKIPSSTN